jgi:hypothetical protein
MAADLDVFRGGEGLVGGGRRLRLHASILRRCGRCGRV